MNPIEVIEKAGIDGIKRLNRELLMMAQEQLGQMLDAKELKGSELIRAIEVLYRIEVPDPKMQNNIQIKVPALFAQGASEDELAALRSGYDESGD
jgi:hypothetical protein